MQGGDCPRRGGNRIFSSIVDGGAEQHRVRAPLRIVFSLARAAVTGHV